MEIIGVSVWMGVGASQVSGRVCKNTTRWTSQGCRVGWRVLENGRDDASRNDANNDHTWFMDW